MTHSTLTAAATLALAGGLVLVACSDETFDPDEAAARANVVAEADAEASARLRAHSPAQHGARIAPSISAASAPAYAELEAAAAEGGGGAVHLSVEAAGAIPRFPDAFISSVAVFGYAWADLDTGQGIVAVIHPTIGRDSRQNPDGWHTHPVQLAAGTTPTGTSDFCIVSIGRSQGGVAMHGDALDLHMSARWAGVPADALDVAAAFVVQADAGCAATGLGVAILTAESL